LGISGPEEDPIYGVHAGWLSGVTTELEQQPAEAKEHPECPNDSASIQGSTIEDFFRSSVTAPYWAMAVRLMAWNVVRITRRHRFCSLVIVVEKQYTTYGEKLQGARIYLL
jgi:hypothetical protein